MPEQLHITNNDDRIINLLVDCAMQELIEAVEGGNAKTEVTPPPKLTLTHQSDVKREERNGRNWIN